MSRSDPKFFYCGGLDFFGERHYLSLTDEPKKETDSTDVFSSGSLKDDEAMYDWIRQNQTMGARNHSKTKAPNVIHTSLYNNDSNSSFLAMFCCTVIGLLSIFYLARTMAEE